ncbi:MAG: P1 family peptidase, partial [Pseudomonadota bacterium]
VMPALRAAGRGFPTSGGPIPIVPAAILYDLGNGGDKAWRESPYAALGRAAFDAAAEDFALGTEGAGTGALSAGLKGGLGSASAVLPSGQTVGAIAAANPVGSVLMGNGPEFRAWAEEVDGEFGGLGPGTPPATGDAPPLKTLTPMTSTTIAIVATDAALTKAEAQRIAIAAHDGIARAVWPAHLPLDGDLVFAVSTGRAPAPDGQRGLAHLGHAAACCLARAIARGIYLARPEPGDVFPAWAARFG